MISSFTLEEDFSKSLPLVEISKNQWIEATKDLSPSKDEITRLKLLNDAIRSKNSILSIDNKLKDTRLRVLETKLKRLSAAKRPSRDMLTNPKRHGSRDTQTKPRKRSY
jgi:hypothetical protein